MWCDETEHDQLLLWVGVRRQLHCFRHQFIHQLLLQPLWLELIRPKWTAQICKSISLLRQLQKQTKYWCSNCIRFSILKCFSVLNWWALTCCPPYVIVLSYSRSCRIVVSQSYSSLRGRPGFQAIQIRKKSPDFSLARFYSINETSNLIDFQACFLNPFVQASPYAAFFSFLGSFLIVLRRVILKVVLVYSAVY